MTFDLVVRNARLVDADSIRHVDIGIADGRIAAADADLAAGQAELNAEGRFVFPGGVDSHVHLGQVSSKGDLTADDFWSGSRSAVFGGTTTVVPFAAQHRGQSIRTVVDDALARAREEMTIDYGMHVIVTDVGPDAAEELRATAAEGLSAVKIYLTYERLKLEWSSALTVMTVAAELGLPVMIHAESDRLVAQGRHRQIQAGELGPTSHAVSHSRPAEWAGVAEAIALAEASGATAYLAHVSTPEAIDMARSARQRGVNVITETCPHYLLLDESRLNQPMEGAAPFLCSPPLRGASERSGLQARLGAGIDLVSSDHSPYTLDQKLPRGPETSFTEAANGLPGIGLRLSLLATAAVAEASDMIMFVEMISTNPARACGLYPRKGSTRVGADADLVVWDQEPFEVRWTDLNDNVGYTPYEGMTLAGRPFAVIAGGDIVVSDSRDETRPGRGQFVRRTG